MTLPNPTEVPAGIHARAEIATHRNVFCPHYDACLSAAVKRGWADFTCAQCPLVDQTPPPSATRYSLDRPRE